jgi:RNA polymerase sigma-70 factor (ECF subfamily)
VYSIAVRVALTELRKSKWTEVSLDELTDGKENGNEPVELPEKGVGVEISVEKKEMAELLFKMMQEVLTEKQRTALLEVAVQGIPLAEVAEQMGTNRNTLYKLLHDARIKLKKQLEKEGLSSSDILVSFENE